MNEKLKASSWVSRVFVNARVRVRVRVRVKRHGLRTGAACATAVCLWAGAPFVSRAVAESATATPDVSEDQVSPREPSDPGRFLPGALAPATGKALAAGFSWAGYDGATHDPLFGAAAEARLGARVIIGAGVTYAAATSLHPGAVRPSVAARLQILDQRRHGLDLGVGFAFRQDRFVEEEGFLEAAVTTGWRSDRTTLLGNLGYGQDGEGDDHEGELRLAGLYRVTGSLHLGLDGRVRKLLDSTDPNRGAHGTPSLEVMTGPVAALMLGPVALVLEAGVSGVRRGSMETGLLTIGSLGAAF